MTRIAIVPYRAQHATRFEELNRAWLEGSGLMEPPDEEQLVDPEAHFLTPGGRIFVALDGDAVVGTCRVLVTGERAKLAVAENYRGQGIARRLVEYCLAHAREAGAARVTLVSSSRLDAAIRLYQSLGFRHRPVPAGTPYQVADVSMVLELGVPTAGS